MLLRLRFLLVDNCCGRRGSARYVSTGSFYSVLYLFWSRHRYVTGYVTVTEAVTFHSFGSTVRFPLPVRPIVHCKPLVW